MEKYYKIRVKPPFIKLNQLLKFMNIISTGGNDKEFIESHQIFVNDVLENRRGRKLYKGDKVRIEDVTYEVDIDEGN
jgi:ribosome-associated protein